MKKTTSFILVLILVLSFALPTFANEAENGARIDKLDIHLTLTETDNLIPHTVRFNLFNANDEFLYNSYAEIKPGTKEIVVHFPVGPFYAGEQFILRLTEGVKAVTYYENEYMAGEPILLSTYAYTDAQENLIVSDTFHLSAAPYTKNDTFLTKAEQFVNQNNYQSKTDYLIWVSKSDYRTVLFKKGENGSWVYRDSFKCTIGAPSTPTITGEFEYHQYQPKWYYEDFWCGPVMRFYGGYALHSTLIRYDGSAYDARLGVKASHGCVRLAPEVMNYLVKVTPMHTAIVVTG
ncbi:MAG: L,D-transpeptidase [Clostridia bacterium]|nr:L,D-transpeptidase [Clostridia bacterium]